MDALEQRVTKLDQRIQQLEKQPTPRWGHFELGENVAVTATFLGFFAFSSISLYFIIRGHS